MKNFTTIFGPVHASGSPGDPRPAKPSSSAAGRGFYQSGPGGIRELPRRFEINHGRVGIQRILRHGQNEAGEVVGIVFSAPEFVSARQAQRLIAHNLARFCGLFST